MGAKQQNVNPTEELEKLAAVREQSQAIGEFLDWLQHEKEVNLLRFNKDGEIDDPEYLPLRMSIEELLAEYFHIDLKKVEQERRQLLDQLQAKQRKAK